MKISSHWSWPLLAGASLLLVARVGQAVQEGVPATPAARQVVPAPVVPNGATANAPAPEGFNRRPENLAPTALPRIHDPVIAQENGVYYLFGTGRGISLLTSKDRVTWQRQGRVFEQPLAWTAETIPGSRDSYWAPDISFFGGKWHLYYSVSTFGKNRSAIGLATNVTLDSKRADYKWEDQGVVTQSRPEDNFNAIDPNVLVDDKGAAWLSFGSFWGGLQLLSLDPATGKAKVPDAKPITIAARPRTREIQGSIEAPFLIQHAGRFYQFASFDFCCRGINSTYNIRVGRSEKIEGPYLDKDGKSMLDGGGTPVLAGSGRWKGTGHNAIFRDKGVDYLVYHAYDAEDNGQSKLQIRALQWDAEGWPHVIEEAK